MSRGILYISTGEGFQKEAVLSARSVRNSMPDCNIAIISDSPVCKEVFDECITIEDPEYNFTDQIFHLPNSPFDETIYLDTDIYMDESVDHLFTLLNQFDIGIAHAQGGISWDIPDVPPSFPEYNSGVIVYNSDTIESLCDSWISNYQELKDDRPQNQPSLRKTLYESDLRIATLPREYNCMYRQPGHVNNSVKLFHGRLMEVNGPGAGMYHDPQEAREKINRRVESRVFTQLGGLRVHSNRSGSILQRIRLTAMRKGWPYVFRRAYQKSKSYFYSLKG